MERMRVVIKKGLQLALETDWEGRENGNGVKLLGAWCGKISMKRGSRTRATVEDGLDRMFERERMLCPRIQKSFVAMIWMECADLAVEALMF
jgi:hypothetical protein